MPGKWSELRLLSLVALVGIAVMIGLWLPRRNEERRIRQQIIAAEAKLGVEHLNPTDVKALIQEVDGLRGQIDLTTARIPPAEELASLLSQVTGALQRQQVQDQEMQARPVRVGTQYRVIPISVQFRTSFPALFAILRELESLPRLVRVTQVQVSGAPGHLDVPLEVRMDLCAFATAGLEATR